MHSENFIFMGSSPEHIFNIASDLSKWPDILPHYRRVTYIEKSDSKNVVVMAAWRMISTYPWAKIPIQWTSEQVIDRQKTEIRFHHLKSFTKGMRVVWTFAPHGKGTNVRIVHDLDSQIPWLGKTVVEPVVGEFFVHFVANQTLKHMKVYVEKPHA